MNTPTPPSSPPWGGSSLALLLREIRAAFWTQMEAELRAAGHELNFSQYITLKHLADGSASVTDEAGVAIWNDINHCGQGVRERVTRGMSDADSETLIRLLTQIRDNLSSSER